MVDSLDPLAERIREKARQAGIMNADGQHLDAIGIWLLILDEWAAERGIASKHEGRWRALTLEEQYEKIALELFTAAHDCRIGRTLYDHHADVWSAIAEKNGKRQTVTLHGAEVDAEFKRRRIAEPARDHGIGQREDWREHWHAYRLKDLASDLLAKRHGSPVYGTMQSGDEWKAFTQVGNRVVTATKEEVRAAFDLERASLPPQPDVRDLMAKAAEDLMAEKAAALGGRHSRVLDFDPLRGLNGKWIGSCIVGDPSGGAGVHHLEATNEEVMVKAGMKVAPDLVENARRG